jgi:trehalose-6-phosphate synthase
MNNQELQELLKTIPQNRRDIRLSEILFSPRDTYKKLNRIKDAQKALHKAINDGYSTLSQQEMGVITNYKREYVR